MALNLEAIFRITAKVRDEGIAKLASGLERVDRASTGASKSFKKAADSALWQGAAVAAGGFLLVLGSGVKAAIEFESAIADVRKVLSGINSPQGLKEVRQEIIGLSREMPITAEGFAQIYAAAGRSGIAREEVKQFAIDAAKMGIAFDISAGEAGDAMTAMRAALGLTQPQVVELADALNYLADNGRRTAAQLVEFVKRSGAVGEIAGLSGEQTAAFGATMIAMGVEVEVAATSFNNMVKALSSGASATARQESAYKRLGLVSSTLADKEKQMTAQVQQQSDRRLEIMQDASDRQLRELRRRYRNEMQMLEDKWDDESSAFENATRDQSDARIEALTKTADAQIKALQEQYKNNETAGDAQIQLVRDQLDNEVEAIRDATDRTLKLQQRANRDKQQNTRDAIDDRMDAEISGIEKANKERERLEKEATANTIASMKEAAGSGGSAIGREMAKRLQDDALGTIRDVMSRIKNLPPEERISVLSDLFGDEARGLTPMINNLAELEKALLLVADKTRYAGSMTQEYNVRSQTTANALQLAKNNFDALAITVGAQMVPALVGLINAVNPAISGLLRFAEANPAITGVVVGVTALAAAFILAAPFIAATISLITGIGVAALGPIALVVAAIAGIALAFKLAWDNFAWFRDSLTAGLAGIVEGWRGALMIIQGILAGDSAIITKGWNMMIDGIMKSIAAGFEFAKGVVGAALKFMVDLIIGFPARIFAGVRAIGQAIGDGISSVVRNILNTLFGWIRSRINGAVDAINFLIRGFNSIPNVPNISTIRSIPAFAQGGFVDKPTLAMIGDNTGGREYAVPEQKAIGFANNILAGRRGPSAIPSAAGGSASPAPAGPTSLTVNLTTGPVMQDESGQRWMTVEDGERMARQMADQLLRSLRTPAGRYITGAR